jgi:CheY-like chemotaxis protein
MPSGETVKQLVLVVDPDPDSRAILCALLAYTGFAVAEADGAAAGLAEALRLLPAVILGEHPMYLEDGSALCERLRRDPATAGIPFVALTTRATASELDDARRTHRLVLTKPADFAAVVRAVNDVAALSRQVS